jgi:dihydroorotase-like cyclic amidohydrolase
MIKIKHVRTVAGEVTDYTIPSTQDDTIDAYGKWLILPGVIDPHAYFGPIDNAHWDAAVLSSINGGITATIEVPHETLPHIIKHALEQKNKTIADRLEKMGIPLSYFHQLPFSKSNLRETDQLGISRRLFVGIMIRLDKGPLTDDWDEVFRVGAQEDAPVVLDAAGGFLEKAIHYTEKWSGRLYVMNVSTEQEIALIRDAKKRALLVDSETTPQLLFQDSKKFLWKAIQNEIIETVGSGFDAVQQNPVKILYKGIDYSFSNPLFLLPMLLTAVHEKKLSLEKVVRATSGNIQDMLQLQSTNNNFVLVDMQKEEKVKKIDSGHSTDLTLKGWPVYTIVNGHILKTSI